MVSQVLMNMLSGCCKPDVGMMRDLVGSQGQPEAQEAGGRHISYRGIQLMIVMVVIVVVVLVMMIW